jgi:Xaa-Pro aminopeptidase
MKDLWFSREEYAGRVRATKERMTAEGIDVLLVVEPQNMYYLTGYDAYSFYVPQGVLVALDEELPVWIGRFMDAVSARRTSYLPDASIVPYPDTFVQAGDRHPMQFVAQYIRERNWASKVIGTEMGTHYYSARSHFELQKGLPSARFKDAELLVNWIRIVKSDQEIAYMREAGKITDRMVARAREVAAPGVRQCDLAAEIVKAQLSGAESYGGLPSSGPPYICAGDRAIEPHASWSDEPLQNDIPINIEMSGVRHRYHAPISRTIYLGTPPRTYHDFASHVVEGLNGALGTVKPGVTCEEVEAVWRSSLARHGLEKEARLGYSVGCAYAPTWGERTASLRKGDRTVLKPNMAFHMMAGLWLEQTGVTITQAFVVTPNGHQPLTASPRELYVVR